MSEDAAATVHPSGLSLDERFAILRSVGEECIAEQEMRNLLEKKPDVRCYDGFEPSGRMHIAQGIFKAINVNKCTRVGCKFTFWVADWFALMNDKLGGELDKIRIVGKYLVEVWTAAGMDMTNVDFRWSSDDINAHANEYWRRVIDIGRNNTIARMKKCCTIMGRGEGSLSAAQILYPLMQCADIFFLKADICQLGVDQRKVNMLAREYCTTIGRKLKPVILSHHMLAGLIEGQGKMSKSNPDSAIFMEDSPEDVARKINQAYCPKASQKEATYSENGELLANPEMNPCLDYIRCVVFSRDLPFVAAGTSYKNYEELESAFLHDRLSEADLKAGLIAVINELLDPVREHFEKNAEAKALLAQVREFRKGASDPAPGGERGFPVPKQEHLVAWMPVEVKLSLQTVVSIVTELNDWLAKDPHAAATLVLPDWSAFATFAVGGEEKDIEAAIAMHRLLFESYGLNPKVQIVLQSAKILGDPNDYWLNVIAAGRKFSLQDIEQAHSGDVGHAGVVVGSLMRIADVIAFGATVVLSLSKSDENLSKLASVLTGYAVCSVSQPAPFAPTLCKSDTPPSTADDWLYSDETELDLRRKIKRAYAAPNDASSPVADIGCFLIRQMGALTVSRAADNGGDKQYTDGESLKHDCASGALHPADLKAAVSPALLSFTEKARDALATPAGKKATTAVKAVEKRLTKKK